LISSIASYRFALRIVTTKKVQIENNEICTELLNT